MTPFNPDNLTPEQIGENYRLMFYDEKIPDFFEYWYKGRWTIYVASIKGVEAILREGDTCTRRLPKDQRPEFIGSNIGDYNYLVSLLEKAVQFELSPMFYANGYILPPDYSGPGSYYYAEKRKSYDKTRWAITYGSDCFSKSLNDFIYECLPSSRTDQFLEDTRFDSIEECFDVFKTWKEDRIKYFLRKGWQYWTKN